MIGKPIQITAAQATGIEMEEAGISTYLLLPDPELGEKVVTQAIRNRVILPENLVQIPLDAPMKPSVYSASAPKPIDRR